MSNEQILTKSIEKALGNGWDMFGFAGKLKAWNVNPGEFNYQTWLYGRLDDRMVWQLKVSVNDIIFNHDFAKAFWGEPMCTQCKHTDLDCPNHHSNCDTGVYDREPWKYHLQQMVLVEDPIKYLKAYL